MFNYVLLLSLQKKKLFRDQFLATK